MDDYSQNNYETISRSTLADFGTRLGAFFIDVAMLSFVGFVIIAFLAGLIFADRTAGQQDASPSLVISVILIYLIGPLFITTAYFTILESSRLKGSLGKKLVGIEVVNQQGNDITFTQALGRNLARIISGILLIGYLMALLTDKKQTLHDLMAGTLVIKKVDTNESYKQQH